MSEPAAKTRVLFVDDEPLVLKGLERMLRPMREQWEMVFVESGPRALQTLAEIPYQVVVTDMRMPGMNGAQLLARVKELHPKTVRLILSGHADKDLILKCVGTAHQFLAKPCEPEALRAAIARASSFDLTLKSERMKQLIGQMDCLPSVPALLNQIVEKLHDENCTLEDVGEVIRKDIAITAKLLKLVNSAFFGLRRQISDPGDAISYLGLEIIKSLVLSIEAFSTFEGRPAGPVTLEALWSHSLDVAAAAKKIAIASGGDKRLCEDCFIAGMLHDIGKLVLAANLPAEYAKVFAAVETGIPLTQAEEASFGANHAEIGGYLLSLWGLPPSVVDAISLHHEPERFPAPEMTPALAVHLADGVVRERANESGARSVIDPERLRALGLDPDSECWKNL